MLFPSLKSRSICQRARAKIKASSDIAAGRAPLGALWRPAGGRANGGYAPAIWAGQCRWRRDWTATASIPVLYRRTGRVWFRLCSGTRNSRLAPRFPGRCPSGNTPNRQCAKPPAVLTRTHFPQTVIASAARQSRRGNERRSWNEIAIRQRRTSLLAMTNWVRVSHFGSLSEAGFTGFIGCTGLGATLPSDDLNPDNPSNPGNPASDIPPPESGYA